MFYKLYLLKKSGCSNRRNHRSGEIIDLYGNNLQQNPNKPKFTNRNRVFEGLQGEAVTAEYEEDFPSLCGVKTFGSHCLKQNNLMC